PGESFALEPLAALVGDAVTIAVRELPDAWRRGHVQGARRPHHAFRKHHAIGEHRSAVEAASAVAVFEAQNAMRLLLQLYVHFIVGPGGIRDIEPFLGVKVRDDRPVDEWRSGDELDLETHGQRKGVTIQLDLMCRGWLISGRKPRDANRHEEGS